MTIAFNHDEALAKATQVPSRTLSKKSRKNQWKAKNAIKKHEESSIVNQHEYFDDSRV